MPSVKINLQIVYIRINVKQKYVLQISTFKIIHISNVKFVITFFLCA